MSFTYNYANTNPPAPFVLVVLSHPDGSSATGTLPAQVDTGAARTVIPLHVATALALREVDRLRFGGLGGVETELPIYEVQFVVRDLAPVVIEAAASDGEQYVLLGRDVLNRYTIVLDGPNGTLQIG